jgi:hypothetical protein
LGLFGKGGDGSNYAGHNDFPGSDIFDYSLEDEDIITGPFVQPQRHFLDLNVSDQDIQRAIEQCDWEQFSRAMHRGQDYFAHFKQGFRWDRSSFLFWKWKVGHLLAGAKPDNNIEAWMAAQDWTVPNLKLYKEKCFCDGR